MDKKSSRLRRAAKTRRHLAYLGVPKLTVHRTPRHMRAQVILPGGKVCASASTLEAEVRTALKGATGNCFAASFVGKLLAERCLKNSVQAVGFDRSGFKYHGRVAALAAAARDAGLRI